MSLPSHYFGLLCSGVYYTIKLTEREIIMAQNPIVTITMENGDVIKLELYPEIAPTSVNNFISLVKKNFYDGLIFHRSFPLSLVTRTLIK